jgi:hypothetical protein
MKMTADLEMLVLERCKLCGRLQHEVNDQRSQRQKSAKFGSWSTDPHLQ